MDHEHTGEYVPKPGRMSRSREKQTHKVVLKSIDTRVDHGLIATSIQNGTLNRSNQKLLFVRVLQPSGSNDM